MKNVIVSSQCILHKLDIFYKYISIIFYKYFVIDLNLQLDYRCDII